jgi:branched-chain amino acid transport system substrate-binding protein
MDLRAATFVWRMACAIAAGCLACAAGSAGAAGAAGAADVATADYSQGVIRIGFITDLSGLYAEIDGMAGAEMIRDAIADMGGRIGDVPVELLVADHQNKPDVAATIAREWLDVRGVDVLVSGTNSAAALSMVRIAAERRKPFLAVGPASAALTDEQCTPFTAHWVYDTVALGKSQGAAVVKAGGKSWYFVTADYAFGLAIEADTARVVKAAGGEVRGAVRHPLSASDFSSFMVQAQASKAQILALANGGPDLVNSVKAANEFGVTRSMRLAGLLIQINDVHALGLAATQGMYVTESWYWDRDDETRAFSRRFFDRFRRMPSQLHAGDYSAALQYLRAVKAARSDDGGKVMAHLRAMKFDDVYMKRGWLRADGRVIHDMYLMQVKAPRESSGAWDYYRLVDVVRGEAAWRTKGESRCSLWK